MCRLMETLFEKFSTPAVFVSKDAVLSCYACGRTSGLTVDCGDSGTVITPVTDGWTELKGLTRSVVGGRVMDALMLNSLRKITRKQIMPLFRLKKKVINETVAACSHLDLKNVHPTYDAYSALEVARDVKETVCKAADSTLIDSDPRFTSIPLLPYELPDGTTVDIGIERFQPPELLFDPTPISTPNFCPELSTLNLNPDEDILTASQRSIPRLIVDSVLKCPIEMQTNLLASIVITGGASAGDNIPERLRNEVEAVVHMSAPAWKVKATNAGPAERGICTWLGGSILASLGSFHEMWITKAEYEEYGAQIVDKKCP
jgi:actin-like protein 6A